MAVDTCGGDHAPQALIAGALLAADRFGIGLTLLGAPDILQPHLEGRDDLAVVPVSAALEGEASNPRSRLRDPKSAAAVGARLLRERRVDALVSAAHTGAVLAAAILFAGRIKGVRRPCIAAPVPTPDRHVLLLDAGANPDCQADNLVEFAVMGSLYARLRMGVERPRVHLLSNGHETGKGNAMVRQAHAALELRTDLDYRGLTEPYSLLRDDVDVLVTDGFSGNLLVKGMETASRMYALALRQAFHTDWRTKMGYWLARHGLERVRRRADPRQYGGAVLLGINGMVVVAHGGSDAESVCSAIRQAMEGVNQRLVARVEDEMAAVRSD